VSRVVRILQERRERELTRLCVSLASFPAPLHSEKGADLAEYALLLALIVVVAMPPIACLGVKAKYVFIYIAAQLACVP